MHLIVPRIHLIRLAIPRADFRFFLDSLGGQHLAVLRREDTVDATSRVVLHAPHLLTGGGVPEMDCPLVAHNERLGVPRESKATGKPKSKKPAADFPPRG